MVAGVSRGKCAVSLVTCPPVLNLVSMFQFFVIEGVRGCRGGGEGKGVVWVMLDLRKFLILLQV